MIYFDKIGHLISSDSLGELHQFAKKIGLKRAWFQDKPGYPHYDLTTERMRNKALNAGAIELSPKKLVQILTSKKY